MPWKLYPAASFWKFSAAWDRINKRGNDCPVLSARVIARALEFFGDGSEKLAVHGHFGSEDALGIFTQRRNGSWESFQPSQLPLGAWLMNPDLSYAAVMPGLLRTLPGLPVMIAITQQDPAMYSRPGPSELLEAIDYARTGWIDIDGTFADYWRGRGAHLRQNIRTQHSKLAAHGVAATLDEISDPQLVAEAIAEYARMETSGWKADAGTAVKGSDAQGRFYRAVLEDSCKVGAGRIVRLSIGVRVVAMDLCIESTSAQVLLKTAYDESLRGFSPSSLLKHQLYERIFTAARLDRIEYFGRFAEWTSRWTDNSRMLFHVNAFRWPGVRTIRHQLKKLRAPPLSVSEHASSEQEQSRETLQ